MRVEFEGNRNHSISQIVRRSSKLTLLLLGFVTIGSKTLTTDRYLIRRRPHRLSCFF